MVGTATETDWDPTARENGGARGAEALSRMSGCGAAVAIDVEREQLGGRELDRRTGATMSVGSATPASMVRITSPRDALGARSNRVGRARRTGHSRSGVDDLQGVTLRVNATSSWGEMLAEGRAGREEKADERPCCAWKEKA